MLLDQKTLPLVAIDFMNDVHLEDLDIINALFELILQYEQNPTEENKENLNNQYKEWISHTIEHFHKEEVMMEEKNFPPYPIHKAEHDNALNQMNLIFEEWNKTNNINILKQYFIEKLPTWLTNHIKTMDTVTAMFFKTGLSPCGG
ncbi:MAG TPA: hypothetical protein ENK66_04570 [Arcobacter sp.]|jgi:hemerythrin|nr:hypothetical protein [Arcobacter sp.]